MGIKVNKDLMLALCLGLLCLVTRLPFASRLLFNSDSTRFALAMTHYDVSQMRPHAPGYILYVAAAKLVNLFVHEEGASLVAVSIIASVMTVVGLYYLALNMFGRSNAILSAALFLSSPLVWYNGEMPFTYVLDAFFGVMFAYSCYQIVLKNRKWIYLSAVFLGLATGVRQSAIMVLLPLWIFALRKSPRKSVLLAVCVFALCCCTWFFPIILLSGGLEGYLGALYGQFSRVVVDPLPYLSQIKIRGTILAGFMVYSLTVGIVPMTYYCGRFFRLPFIISDARLQLMLIWVVPATLFYLGVTLYNPGQVIVILPPLFVFLSESLKALAADVDCAAGLLMGNGRSRSLKGFPFLLNKNILVASSVILILAVNVWLFIFADTAVSYDAIKSGDQQLAEHIKLTHEVRSPQKAMILACRVNTQAGYYLPDYLICCPFPLIFSRSIIPIEAQNVYFTSHHDTTPRTYWMPTDFILEPIPLPDYVDTLVVWEDEIAGFYVSDAVPLGSRMSASGLVRIYFLKVRAGEKIYYDFHKWSVR
ncbi:MAG: glycosyltransferase family 39 protein [Acidobacteriia bacterium]|nr:glycosyltransferase family 39 protein [Terriglobia bacterium]